MCYTVLGTSSSKKTLHNRASISSSTHSIHSLSSMPGDMSQVDGRVGRWALGFDKLMEDPAGLGCFKVHTQKIIIFKIFGRLAACSWFSCIYCLQENCKPLLKILVTSENLLSQDLIHMNSHSNHNVSVFELVLCPCLLAIELHWNFKLFYLIFSKISLFLGCSLYIAFYGTCTCFCFVRKRKILVSYVRDRHILKVYMK